MAVFDSLKTVFDSLKNEIDDLRKSLQVVTRDLFTNQQQLKLGLDSAEFNLRAHQKVINCLMLELRQVWEEGTPLKFVEIVELSTGVEGAKSMSVDWSAYHKYVEKDMRDLESVDRNIRMGQVDVIEKELPAFKLRVEEELLECPESELPSRRAASAAFFSALEKDMCNVREGNPYSTDKLDRMSSMIAASANALAAGASITPEEQGALVDAVDAPVEEHVTVFGG